MAVAYLTPLTRRTSRCFVESDAGAPVVRRSLAEAIGTMLLMVAVVGSGMASGSQPLSPALAVSGALIGLILSFGSVSGGHFNPVITVMQWRAGQRGAVCTVSYVLSQICGGVLGTLAADLVFATPPGGSTLELTNISAVASEALSTFGLMMVVFCSSRSTSRVTGPFAVGLWLLGAIVATPTRSITNPAVAVSLLASPSGASLFSVAAFVVVQFGRKSGGPMLADALPRRRPTRWR